MAWKIDWSLYGEEIISLYVDDKLSAREVAQTILERHGVTYKSGTLTNFLGRAGVLRHKTEACKLAISKSTRVCEVCGKSHVPRSYNQRWCDDCTGMKKYSRRIRMHGLPAIIIEDMFKKQNKRCGICGKEYDDLFNTQKEKSLCIDHDHKTMQFRGLLCVRCNTALSYVDDTEWLKSAQKYIADATAVEQPTIVRPQRKNRYVRSRPVGI
jgi:hypothetical protein